MEGQVDLVGWENGAKFIRGIFATFIGPRFRSDEADDIFFES